MADPTDTIKTGPDAAATANTASVNDNVDRRGSIGQHVPTLPADAGAPKRSSRGWFNWSGRQEEGNLNGPHTADAPFVVPESQQPGRLGRWSLYHAGGAAPEYYTKSQARRASILAIPKFAAAGMATYALSKMGYKIVAPALEGLGQVGGWSKFGLTIPVIDLSTLLLAGASLLVFKFMISVDTSAIRLSRQKATGKYFQSNGGDELGWKNQSRFISLYRYGVICGSLLITLPSFMAGANQGKIDTLIQARANGANAPIYRTVDENLAKHDALLTTTRTRLTGLRTGLVTGPQIEIKLTAVEEQTQTSVRQRIDALQAEITALEARRLAEEAEKDKAETKMRDEERGTRGAVAGRKRKWNDARAERDEVQGRIDTLNATIKSKRDQIATAQAEIRALSEAAERRADKERTAAASSKDDIRGQIVKLEAALAAQEAERVRLADRNARAKEDPKFVDPNPDVAEEFSTYANYLFSKDSNYADWFPNIGLLIMLGLLEGGVFLMASGRPVDEGEKNAYKAALAISRAIKSHGDEREKFFELASALHTNDTVTRKKIIEDIKANPAYYEHQRQQVVAMMRAAAQGNPEALARDPLYQALVRAEREENSAVEKAQVAGASASAKLTVSG